MEKKEKRIGISDAVLLVISAVFLVGIRTFLQPCGPKEDGSWMACHWAGQAVTGVAAAILVMAIVHMLVSDAKIKIGLSIALIPSALLAGILPGHLIHLCMMNTMRCHVVMKSGTLVMAILTVIAAVFDILLQRRKG